MVTAKFKETHKKVQQKRCNSMIRQMRMADVKGGILKSFASVQDKVCSMCHCSREKPYHLIGVSKRWGQQKIKATFQIEKEMKP